MPRPGRSSGLRRTRGIAEIMVPRTVLVLPRLPRLGTGKPDYPAIRLLAEAEVTAKDGPAPT